MDNKRIIDKIISAERFAPYMQYHRNNTQKAMIHYKANIFISEAFYPLLSILEVGLRNSINYQLTRKFKDEAWYENPEFIKLASQFQKDRISEAKNDLRLEKKDLSPGKIIASLSFGFWTSLFDKRFQGSLWKNLRLAFPLCPKPIRQRQVISSTLNTIRKLRNRIFHHEAIAWNLSVINSCKEEILKAINWLDENLIEWMGDLYHLNHVIETEAIKIRKRYY